MYHPAPNDRLQRLASQHHASEYSRAKFGHNGSPVRYLPLSIQFPDHFAQLVSRQLVNSQQRAWWPATEITRPSISLQDEIMDAMSEPLQRSSQTQLKTSLTHPINISYIIPADLVDLISSHALRSASPTAPVLFEVPPSFTLDRLSSLRDIRFQTAQAMQPPPPPFFPTIAKHTTQSHFRTRSNVTDALQAAINSGLEYGQDTHIFNEQATNRFVTEFSPEANVSVSLSMTIPASGLVFPDSRGLEPDYMLAAARTPPMIFKPSPFSINAIPHKPVRDSSVFTVGNLFLSSCPGKKIRLDGPVRGRSGVRRDVETDMRRMKELGVGCIVCCLDDTELEFLGAPWPEYQHCAEKIGIDVLRLPIPEGLPPTSAACLDEHLVELINRYTIHGVPILVHCRGGVGRAGVVACCWMIRVGLCGWLRTADNAQEHGNASGNDVVSFVEKVIALIRRRRSMKAVETYEQVKFLVEYVEHLQRQADMPHCTLTSLIPMQRDDRTEMLT